MSRVRVLSLASLPPGQMQAIDMNGTLRLAAFNVEGRICVTSNLCTHSVATLTDGYFEGDTVECPLHGGCFNVLTGKATHFPCETPLRTYPVILDGDEVFVEIDRVPDTLNIPGTVRGDPVSLEGPA
ncbi:MAG: non-heme iron oxygenase ferredoxin subunit [Panacagrimonas sp.]